MTTSLKLPLQEKVTETQTGKMTRPWISWFEDLIRYVELVDTSITITNAHTYGLTLSAGYIPDNSVVRGTGGFFGVTGSDIYIDDSANITGVNSITFDTAGSFSYAEGLIGWDADRKTLVINNDVEGAEIYVGQTSVIRVVNKTGSPLSKGDVVYVSGSQGNRPTVALADADLATAHRVIGVVKADIADNNNGYVLTQGELHNIDTSSWAEGTILYLSQTAGELTDTEPSAPAHRVCVCLVMNQHATEGIICVKPQIGQDLSTLDDVLITSIGDGEILTWDNGNNYWKNETLDEADIASNAANMTDNTVIRGDGGANGIQDSGIIIDDSDNINFPADITFSGDGSGLAYGSMYGDDISETVTISSTDTWTEVNGGNLTAGQNNLTSLDSSYRIQVTNAGIYKIDWCMVVSTGAAAQYIEGTICVNATASPQAVGATESAVANKQYQIAGTCILDLAASDYISLCVENDTSTQDIIVTHANLSIVQVGGS